MLKVFSLSDAAVSDPVCAGICRRSILCGHLLTGADWGSSVWHRWWRIPLPFQEWHSGVSMAYKLLQFCFSWPLPYLFKVNLDFSKMNWWFTLCTPKLTLLWVACSSWSSLWPRNHPWANCLSFVCCACHKPLVQFASCFQKAGELTPTGVKRKCLLTVPH